MSQNENVSTERIIPTAAIIAFVPTEMSLALTNFVLDQMERF